MELDGVDPAIHLYALHPGGVLTGMGGCTCILNSVALSETRANLKSAGPDPDITEKYGKGVPEADFLNLFKDPPALCGQTCAFLASGRAKDLRGLYLGQCDTSCGLTEYLFAHYLSRLSTRSDKAS